MPVAYKSNNVEKLKRLRWLLLPSAPYKKFTGCPLGKRPIDTDLGNEDDGDQERAIECPKTQKSEIVKKITYIFKK